MALVLVAESVVVRKELFVIVVEARVKPRLPEHRRTHDPARISARLARPSNAHTLFNVIVPCFDCIAVAPLGIAVAPLGTVVLAF
jgi:hypothetical protein